MESQDKLKNSGTFMRHGLIVFSGTVVGSFFFLFLCAIYFGDPVLDSILSAHGILVNTAHPKINAAETALINKMIADGAILPASNILTTTISYYESIISILAILMGILGTLAFFYIRSVSARDAEDMAESASKKYFESPDFKSNASESLKTNWQEMTKTDWGDMEQLFTNYDEAIAKIEKMESRMITIEEKLAATESLTLSEEESK